MIKFLVIVALVGTVFAGHMIVLPEGESGRRVIGGADTTIEKAPYQVSVQTTNGTSITSHCGGSIIAKNWVLTAAHCMEEPYKYFVRAGSTKTTIGGSFHRVSRMIVHEGYYQDEKRVPVNDIALLQVDPPFQMDSTRRIIELYESGEETEVGTSSLVTGWGRISPVSSIYPDILQKVKLPIISKAQCKKACASFTKFKPGQICTAYPGGNKDACQGDSGGPLVVKGRLAGIVSWGRGCAVEGLPGVYTEVAYYRHWIDDALNRTMEE